MNGRIIDVNRAFLEETGYGREEVISALVKNFLTAESCSVIDEMQRELKADARVDAERIEFIRKNGDRFGCRMIVSDSGSGGDSIENDRFYITNIDKETGIEDGTIKATEDALKSSETRLTGIVNSVTDHMSIIDRDLTVLWANRIARDVFGPNIVGKKCYQVYHCSRKPCPKCLARLVFEEGRTREHETIMVDKNGDKRYYWSNVSPAGYDEDGKPNLVVEVSRDITDRKEAMEALEESKARYLDIFEGANDGMIYTDRKTIVLEVNEAFLRLTDIKREEVAGKSAVFLAKKLLKPKDIPGILIIIKDSMLGKSSKLFELEYNDRTFEISTRSDPDRSGITGILRDITEIKKAQKAQWIAEETYRNLFMNSQVGLFRTKLSDGSFLEANDRLALMMGYRNREELFSSGERITERYVSESGRVNMLNILNQKGKVENYETEFYRKDGTVIWCRFSGSINSERSWFDGVAEDITAEREALDALKESEEKFRSIIRSSPMGTFLFRLEQKDKLVLFEANPSADKMLKTDHKKLLGLTIEEALPALADTELPGRFKTTAWTGQAWQIENFSYKNDRVKGIFDVNVFQTSPEVIAVMFIDVTEKVTAENERRKMEQQFLQSQKMESIGRLAGGVAHDFNNLLTSILGNSELIISDLNENDPLQADMLEIHRSGERAAELTRQLLVFSRKQVMEPSVVNLNMIITDMEKMLKRLIGEHIFLNLNLHDDLWCIQIDPGQIEQVLLNLVINARDAMQDGGSLDVETENCTLDDTYPLSHPAIIDGEYVSITVTDTGTGIDKEIHDHIFEPFFTTKEEGKGTGLGLSTVYGIVKLILNSCNL